MTDLSSNEGVFILFPRKMGRSRILAECRKMYEEESKREKIERNWKQYPKPTLRQSLEAWCLLNDLIHLGYPHDFQKELPHIRSYMWKVTDLVRDAIHIRDGRENEADAPGALTIIGGRMNGKVEFAKAVNERKGEKNVGRQPEAQPKGKPPVEKTKGAETMQRLIDADAIGYDFGEINDGKNKWWDLYVTNEAIAQQPTIDAVPMSFIEKKIESIRQYLSEHEGEEFMSGLISKVAAYEKLIEEWREENGQIG